MTFLSLLNQQGKKAVFPLSIFVGIIAGIGQMVVLAMVNQGIHMLDQLNRTHMLIFAATAVAAAAMEFVSQYLMTLLAEGSLSDLRRRLARGILATPLAKLEQMGSGRLYAALSDDISTIGNVAATLPVLCVQATVLISVAAYLTWLSPKVTLTVAAGVALGMLIYKGFAIFGERAFDLGLQGRNQLFGHFRDLTSGIKELQQNRQRRLRFFHKDLEPSVHELKGHQVRGSLFFGIAGAWVGLIYLFTMAAVVVVMSGEENGPEIITGSIMAILYMMGPLEAIMAFIPGLTRAQLAMNNIDELGISLDEPVPPKPEKRAEPVYMPQQISLEDIVFRFPDQLDERGFALGPLNLDIHRGEVLFITGGNGSGKTTLAKVIAGLYHSESGRIFVDGKPVTNQDLDEYRQLFSTIFFDFHLFRRVVDEETLETTPVEDYLKKLEIQDKVTLDGDQFSTTTALSQGQRKRLSLVAALLEDRPVLLFDEWAADQDPNFRNFFYRNILPELKAQGKTIVVISHDARFFDQADRIVHMDYGQIKDGAFPTPALTAG